MQKKKILLTAVVLGGLAALSMPLGVLAQDATTADSFITILASKLGLQSDVVEQAVTETRSEIRSTMEEEHKAEIDTAVTDGLLTQRQGDLLKGLIDNRPDTIIEPDFSDSSKTKGQVMAESEVELLNNAGFNTTVQELQEAKEAARESGVERGGRGKAEHSVGFGMGKKM